MAAKAQNDPRNVLFQQMCRRPAPTSGYFKGLGLGQPN